MSDRLNVVERGGLDLLADMVAASHEGTEYTRSSHSGRWGYAFSDTTNRGFHIVARGAVWLRLEGEEGLRRLEEGDIVLLRARHALLSDPESEVVEFTREHAAGGDDGDVCLMCGVYRLSGEAHPVFDNLPPLIHVPRDDREATIDAVVELLERECASQAPGGRAIVERLVDALLLYILRHWLARACPREAGWLKALRDPVLARALALMHNDYGAPWTLTSLARAAGTSRASLSRHFTAEVGASPIHYLTERRLDVARRLLEGTARSLDEVAAEVGYGSGFALSKAFKRRFGLAPTHFVRRGVS